MPLFIQQFLYFLKTLDKRREKRQVANLHKTDIRGVTVDDELMKRYLFIKFLNKNYDQGSNS